MTNLIKDFFFIELDHLGESALFPFHIHVYNPVSKVYTPYLYANSPLTSAKRELLKQIQSKGGRIAIPMKQKRTLLKELMIEETDIPDLKPTIVHELEKRQERNKAQFKDINATTSTGQKTETVQAPAFHFKHELAKAANDNDFSKMIQFVRGQLAALSPRVSSTTTLASLLAEELLTEDDLVSRTVALCYLLAKGCGITDDESLGDLTVAAFYSHLGYTQLSYSSLQIAQNQLSDQLKKDWKKHPGLSLHLLRKAQIEISERARNIIEQHHERYDGQGFPFMKKGAHIETLALILGAASHILEYTQGMVTGNKTALTSYVLNVKNKTYLPGMECEFGPLIEESLAYLVDTISNPSDNKKAA